MTKILSSLFIILLTVSGQAAAKVTFEKEVKIANNALFFDGDKVPSGAPDGPKYDYFFGNKITPHGDCIKEYKGYVFMTWYRGGESDRHVMLSRYNSKTGVTKTIEFPHRHTGFLNQPHIGESHNTIAVGVSPKDGTIHLLYDMHSYSENRPKDGAFSNDYFRYSYSIKDAATVPDDEFTLNLFVNSNRGNYKHLQMRPDVDYRSLTYPHFFTNKQGDLFMWIREGGNNNGAYKFAKYDGNTWSKFTQFNVMNARSRGISYNWGLYGDIKFESGKMRIGFARRANIKTDAYVLNNGFYYGYTDDPLGETQWKNHKGEGFNLPLIDPEKLKIAEPGDVLDVKGTDSVRMTAGADWTVTDNGDIHFVSWVRSTDKKLNVHSYKGANDSKFKTATNFPGGSLYTYKNQVYLIGIDRNKVFIEQAQGGTNNWTRIYTGMETDTEFQHGVVHISDGKLYYYMMEKASGSARPIHLQIIDLGLDDGSPIASAPQGYSFAAEENDLVEVVRPVDIAYGAEGNFIYRTNRRTDVRCINALCSIDPAPGIPKQCYVKEAKTSYGEAYISIPGTFEAEHYDYGGHEVSYFDSSPAVNKGEALHSVRTDEGVDLVSTDSGVAIGWIGPGEWVEYSVYVHTSGQYRLRFHVASANGEGLINLNLDGFPLATNLKVSNTVAETSYQSLDANVNLTEGLHTLRIVFEEGGFNLDRIEATLVPAVSAQ